MLTFASRGIWVSSDLIGVMMRDPEIFSSFDEIYLTSAFDKTSAMGTGHFTTDGFNFGKNVSNAFIAGFRQLGAVRYLSDGCGLNFVCENQELANQISNLRPGRQ